ncbi:MAG: DUF433 domain-containing protein [Thermoanaerobaculaceae bacterium]
MSVRAVPYPHVTVGATGRARVGATGIAVSQLVAETTAYGWGPAELHFQHPDLARAEIHAALAYYWDHAAEVDREVAEELADIERRDGTVDPPLRARLAATSAELADLVDRVELLPL